MEDTTQLIDKSVIEKHIDKDKRKKERNLNDIRKILSTPEGRRFYWRLLSNAGCFLQSFTGEVNTTIFNEGRRSVGLNFLNDALEAKPSSYSQMQDEYQSELKMEEQIEKEEIEKQNAQI